MNRDALHDARILVVDDEEMALRFLVRFLEREGYRHVHATADSRTVPGAFAELAPDLVIVDLHMPGVSGFMLLEFIAAAVAPGTVLPVLAISGDDTPEVRRRALAAGARDVVAKPFDPTELAFRIRHLLHTRALHLELERRTAELTAEVAAQEARVGAAQLEVLDRLAEAATPEDGGSARRDRVARLAGAIGRALGMAADDVALLEGAARLHDVGRVALPERLRARLDRPAPADRETLRAHARAGAALLAGGTTELLRLAGRIARHRHEHWDGTGVPDGLAGKAIPREARIVAVADAYDRLAHPAGSPPHPPDDALATLTDAAGTRFDPDVVAALRSLSDAARAPRD